MKRVVAVDATPATRPEPTGTEVYARELVRRLPEALPDVCWRFYSARPGTDLGVDLTVLPMRRLWSQLRLPVELRAHPPDLLFVPSHAVPLLYRGHALTTVHDLAFERFPAAYSSSARRYLQMTTRYDVRKCPRLIAVSAATRDDLVELYGADPARITVVPHGVSPPPAVAHDALDARLDRLGVKRPFVLNVGRVEAKKNQLVALQASLSAEVDIVFAGSTAGDAGLAARLAASPRARVLGRVASADLEALYAAAECLLFPSLYEGFGLPVLEAMIRGLPVVTVPTSSLPEVGGPAALYATGVDDVGGLAAGIRKARGPERPRIVAAGRAQAAKFSWEATAAGVAAVIDKVLSGAL